MVNICATCGRTNPDDAGFCNGCGAVLAAASAPRAQRKTVTVLFCDVTGSTAMGERLDPESLRQVMRRYFDAARMVIERHGKVGYAANFGVRDPGTKAPMTDDTIFRIYSMSKPITGVAMMQLYEQGKWQLDDPITKYAPELANLKALTWDKDGKVVMNADGTPVLTTLKKPATMRQLMSHTAGFGYGFGGEDPVNKAFRRDGVLASKDLDEMMRKIANIPLLYEPGTRWSYSVAVDIQGYLVQKLSGVPFGEFLPGPQVPGVRGADDDEFADRVARAAGRKSRCGKNLQRRQRDRSEQSAA